MSDKRLAQLGEMSLSAYSGEIVLGWRILDEFKKEDRGFRAVLFQKESEANTFAVAFRGTNNPQNMIDNAEIFFKMSGLWKHATQGLGEISAASCEAHKELPEICNTAVEFFIDNSGIGIHEKSNLYFTGHSLGGYLAVMQAVRCSSPNLDIRAVVFDSPGLSDSLLEQLTKPKKEFCKTRVIEILSDPNVVNTFGSHIGEIYYVPYEGKNFTSDTVNSGVVSLNIGSSHIQSAARYILKRRALYRVDGNSSVHSETQLKTSSGGELLIFAAVLLVLLILLLQLFPDAIKTLANQLWEMICLLVQKVVDTFADHESMYAAFKLYESVPSHSLEEILKRAFVDGKLNGISVSQWPKAAVTFDVNGSEHTITNRDVVFRRGENNTAAFFGRATTGQSAQQNPFQPSIGRQFA